MNESGCVNSAGVKPKYSAEQRAKAEDKFRKRLVQARSQLALVMSGRLERMSAKKAGEPWGLTERQCSYVRKVAGIPVIQRQDKTASLVRLHKSNRIDLERMQRPEVEERAGFEMCAATLTAARKRVGVTYEGSRHDAPPKVAKNRQEVDKLMNTWGL